MKSRIIFLIGPTAIGKTKIAVYLAKKLNAEIISCDSMQIYRGMDIITSKPPLTLRRRIPHHLIDIVSPVKDYNVAWYRRVAVRIIKEIINRGKVPLFVGGSGLYMSILIDGIFSLETKNEAIRRQLYKQAEIYGSQYLYEKLKKIDTESAARIHIHDTRRIVRALEVFQSSGKQISCLQKQRKGLSDEYGVVIFGLNMDRENLYKGIDERVEKMFAQGLTVEVKKLLKRRLSRTASFAIGMRELKGYFEGLYDLEEAKRLIKQNTRQYAKRQLTWFRKDKRIKWINISDKEKPPVVANKIWKELS